MSAPDLVLALARVVSERIHGDLPSQAGEPVGFPEQINNIKLSQLLGIFHLFSSARMRPFRASATDLPNATPQLEEQAATSLSVAQALAQWPTRWNKLVDFLGDFAEVSNGGPRRLVTHSEAHAPYIMLERQTWSPAADYPAFLRMQVASALRDRRVFVGRRRLYVAGARHGEPGERWFGPHVFPPACASPLAGARSDDLVSPAAVRELFWATEYQMNALRKLGLLPSKSEWISAKELDASLERLNARTEGRRHSDLRPYVALESFSPYRGRALELHLTDILAGRTPCVSWAVQRPSGLANIFIPAESAARHADGPE